jgi:hypothetical protein
LAQGGQLGVECGKFRLEHKWAATAPEPDPASGNLELGEARVTQLGTQKTAHAECP